MHWNQRWARTSCWEVKHTRALASCFLSAKTWRKIKHGPTCFFRVNLLPRTTKLHHSAVQHQHAGGENMCLDWNWSGNPPRHVETLWTPHSSLCTRPLPVGSAVVRPELSGPIHSNITVWHFQLMLHLDICSALRWDKWKIVFVGYDTNAATHCSSLSW